MKNVLMIAALASMMAMPFSAAAQSRSDWKKPGNSQDKNRNRNDNGWMRGNDKNRGNDYNRDQQRRYEDQRRQNEQRRLEQIRREQQQRYDAARRQDQLRRDQQRRLEEQRRWEQDRFNQGRYNDGRYNDDRRQDTKNEWRNLAIGAGLVGVLGLLKGDDTLTFGGAAGALYSLYRYEQDRKSQNSHSRARAHYFSQDHFYRDGVRFNRREVNKNGQRYYQFFRSN